MLSKIFLTTAVIIGAFFVLRQRHIKSENAATSKSITVDKAQEKIPSAKDELAADLRAGAYIFLMLMGWTWSSSLLFRLARRPHGINNQSSQR